MLKTKPRDDSRHNDLCRICKDLPTDFKPYGKRSRTTDYGPDCFCGCEFFHPLFGAEGNDWGVCFNPKSPRAGLLTFEHQGCKHFKEGKAE